MACFKPNVMCLITMVPQQLSQGELVNLTWLINIFKPTCTNQWPKLHNVIRVLQHERHLLGTLLMARRGLSTRTVRMADRLAL